MGKIRVLHCPTMAGSNPQQLARAEREIGLLSWSIAYEQTYGYEADEILRIEGQNPLISESKRWWVLWRALKNYDIIHFNFGRSIMPPRVALRKTHYNKYHWLTLQVYNFYARVLELRDLPLLKRAGKGIVVTYQGDDARQGDFCRANFKISPVDEVEPGYYSAKSDTHKRHKIAQFARYADRIYTLNPDLLHVLPPQSQFMPYANVDLRDWEFTEPENHDPKVPVVIHAPSYRGVKGTRYVLDTISQLKREGIALEFILVEGLSHTEVRRIYERADMVIDQLLCGWYGGLAVEVMALGKPVICYIRENDLRFIPQQMREELPIINATPATFYDVLKQWLTTRKYELPALGRRSRAYVEKWHDSLKIAAKM
ncbi:MAG: glycosyltransferase family 1 protein, partial [Promethearchaeota archaeon]